MKADGTNHTQVAAPKDNPVRGLKDMLNSEYVKQRFGEVMGEKSPAFLASVLNAIRLNPMLSKCDPQSVLGSALVAASLDLPIDANLGFSAMVPYKNKQGVFVAQFQIMYKGLIQLALRSGQYRTINVTPIYEDEYKGVNILSGDLIIEQVEGGYREQDIDDKIVGYAAFFRLLNGFEKIEYWPIKKIVEHGRRYSKSFSYDTSLWKTNPHAMYEKTVLKNMLSQWGILSTTMQTAMRVDQAAINSLEKPLDEANIEYVDRAEHAQIEDKPEEAKPKTAKPEPVGKPVPSSEPEPEPPADDGPDLF